MSRGTDGEAINFAERWAVKNKLEIKKTRCLGCGDLVLVNIPCSISGAPALRSGDHGCADEYTQYYFILDLNE